MQRRDHSVARNGTEDDGAQPLPLLREVAGVGLREEHGQDHGERGDQVHLAPVLGARKPGLVVRQRKRRTEPGRVLHHTFQTYSWFFPSEQN